MRRIACCALLAALLCCRFARAEAPVSIEQTGEGNWDAYAFRDFRGEGISFREWTKPGGPDAAPLLILLHGASSDKMGVTAAAQRFADLGYAVVAPDLAGHGDCATDEPLAIFDIISRSAENVERIVSFYAGRDCADAENFGIAGSSLGAMTALYYAANGESRPRCTLSFLGTPDFSSLVEGNSIYSILQNGAGTPISTRRELILIGYPMIVHSPDLNMDALLRAPLLMVNGGADAVIPLDGVKAFAQRAEESHPGKLTLVIHEEAGHDLTVEQWCSPEVRTFLAENLPVGA